MRFFQKKSHLFVFLSNLIYPVHEKYPVRLKPHPAAPDKVKGIPMGVCHRFAGGFAGAQPRLAKIAQFIAIFQLRAVIVNEAVVMELGFSLRG